MMLSRTLPGKPAALFAVVLSAVVSVGGAQLACAQNLGTTDRLQAFNPERDIPTERVLVPGLVGWWRFDETEGLVAPDAAGSNDGRLAGFTSPQWPRGELGRALEFDGASANAVVIRNAPALNPGSQISLSAWIYSYTAGRRRPETIIGKGAGSDTQYSLAIERGGVIRFTLGASSLSSETKILPNSWTHVLASFDGETMRLYLNGRAEPETLDRSGPIAATESDVLIGSASNADQPAAFNGLIDDVRIYSVGQNFAAVANLFTEDVHNSNSEFDSRLATSNYGNVYSVDTPAAAHVRTDQNWWRGWLEGLESGPFLPGSIWATACNAPIDQTGKTLECFLQRNPNIASAIVWRKSGSRPQTEVDVPWTHWDAQAKKDLAEAFYYAFEWMNGGLQSFGGYSLVDPPVNQFAQPDTAPAITEFAPQDAWHLYVNTIAQSLAVEIGGFVPWTITGYSTNELQTLFDSNNVVSLQMESSNTLDPSVPAVWGYVPAGFTMDAPPTTFFQFLVDHNMIRGNHKTTIDELINWSRFNLLHISNWTDISAAAFEGWWNYRGSSPGSAVLSGTLGPYRPLPPFPPALIHNWVQGCHGVVTLYQGLLRTVNIPTDYAIEFGHGMPIWWTVSESLSHGDDMESCILCKTGAESNKPSTWENWHKYPEASEYPITLTDFNEWFVGPNASSLNVGRQDFILMNVKYPDDDLLTMYCYDKAHGLSHANGTVLASLQGSPFLLLFPLQALESMGFWNTLASESAQFGFCGP